MKVYFRKIEKQFLALSLLLIISPVFVLAQEGAEVVEFAKTTHYFGTFPKSKGPVSYDFEYVNNSDKPLILTKVHSSCGCTASKFSKHPVMPGKKGSVTVTFDPAGYSGYFSKRVTVYFAHTKKPYYLMVSGRIRINHKVEDAFVYFVGDLRADRPDLDLGNVEKGSRDMVKGELRLINVMNDSIKWDVVEYPSWIDKCEVTNKKMTQGDNSRLIAYLNMTEMEQWGEISGEILLRIERARRVTTKRVPVSVYLHDVFSDLNEAELEVAPLIRFDNDEIEVSYDGGKAVSVKITVYNDGPNELLIRNVQSSDPRVEVKKFDEKIKAQSKGRITIACTPGEEPVELNICNNTPDDFRKVIVVK